MGNAYGNDTSNEIKYCREREMSLAIEKIGIGLFFRLEPIDHERASMVSSFHHRCDNEETVLIDQETLSCLKSKFTSRLLAAALGINSRIVREWYSGNRAIPARHLAAIHRYLSTGSFSECYDVEGPLGIFHFEGGLRRDGTRIRISKDKVHS